MPADVSRQGTALLNQQFWLWGRDIRHPRGNILVEHGFTKHSPPECLRVPSRYELSLPDEYRLVLWGFGLFFADASAGGLFLGRMKLAPRLCPAPGEIWEPARLPSLSAPATPEQWHRIQALLVPALRWIGGYESWVTATYGESYRQDCLDAWRRTVCRSSETASRWLRVAAITERSLQRALGANAVDPDEGASLNEVRQQAGAHSPWRLDSRRRPG